MAHVCWQMCFQESKIAYTFKYDYLDDTTTINKPLRRIILGTSKYPDIESYCEKVDLKKYDTFLILAASRFTQNDLLLAKKVREMKKSFFFVRNKIDVDVKAEKQKRAFNEDLTLSNIRKDALENLKDLVANDEEVFLISSHKTKKWDFSRLTEAILDSLPCRQKEALTLSLDLQTTQSKDILKRKADVLRGGYTIQSILFCNFFSEPNLHYAQFLARCG